MFGIGVDATGQSGGLALFWKKDVVVSLLSFSRSHIDVTVSLRTDVANWRFTGFYGNPKQEGRRDSWNLLSKLGSQLRMPWLVSGDFNEVLSNDERLGGAARPPGMIRAFQICLQSCDLTDLGFEGERYTWSNKQIFPDTIRSRLDRSVANSAWISKFPDFHVSHLSAVTSDHSPVLTILKKSKRPKRKKRTRDFKFEAMWLRHEECAQLVEQEWTGGPLLAAEELAWAKIDQCRIGLVRWSKAKFKDPEKRIKELEEQIIKIRQGIITEQSKALERKLKEEIDEWYAREERKWQQRAKSHWLKEGDRNTSYFHSRANNRREKNTIQKMMDENKSWCTSETTIRGVVERYFTNMFTSRGPVLEEIEEVLSCLNSRVSAEENGRLRIPFNAAEVDKALSQMSPLKAPGPDGMPPLFFQRFWPFVRNDVVNCVLRFLNHGQSSQSMHFTHVVLIPKNPSPETMSQLRPISLCTVLYKLASKTVANRLKPVMDSIISQSQSAFVPNRLITDNVLVAFEINHYIKHKKKGKMGHFALKLDMSKAYNRVEWNFLERVLSRLGFEIQFVNLIMRCVTSVKYAFVLNGSSFGNVSPERGLRQGDPLSPYLFLICAEVFSRLLECDQRIQGVAICRRAPSVSHILFADDTMIFAQADDEAAEGIREALHKYEKVSGQEVNYQKSSIVFSPNVADDSRERILHLLGVQLVSKHDKYLGLPTVVGAKKCEVFQHIRERIWNKIKGWSEKTLSQAGKEVLIKAVLQAIPSYAMSCFKLPDTLINEIEQMIRAFWWNSGQENKIHWAKWKLLCKSKQEGGLGFRNLKAFNLALLAKQCWRIITNPRSLLSRILKARYFRRVDFLDAKIGYNPSLTWRSLIAAKDVIEAGTRWRIGNGENTRIWADRWLPRPVTFRPTSQDTGFPNVTRVVDLIRPDTRTWNEALISQIFLPLDAEIIYTIPIGSPHNRDRLIWHYNKDGRFSVKSAYRVAKFELPDEVEAESSISTDWKFIWQARVAPKIKVFIWKLCKNAIPTLPNLRNRHCEVDIICYLCGTNSEARRHLFFECDFARQVWALTSLPWRHLLFDYEEIEEWVRRVCKKLDIYDGALFLTTLWSIWWHRNKRAMEDETPTPIETVSFAKNFCASFLAGVPSKAHQPPQQPLARWAPPCTGCIKINFDGAIFRETNEYGWDICARDSSGSCVAWSSCRCQGNPTPELAETYTAKAAADLILRRGWEMVIVEGDCKVLLDKLGSAEEDFSDYGNFVQNIKDLLVLVPLVRLSIVRREANMLAHRLARNARHLQEGELDIPDNVYSTFVSDLP